MFSVRVLAFITAFLLPVFFSGDRLEKTVIAESGVPLSLVLKNECTVPLELYLTAEESQGEVKLLRMQNGQSVMLFSGDSAALGFAEIYIGTLTAEESMTFTVQCGEGGNAKLHIHGEKQENAAGKWIVRASLLFGWACSLSAARRCSYAAFKTAGKSHNKNAAGKLRATFFHAN